MIDSPLARDRDFLVYFAVTVQPAFHAMSVTGYLDEEHRGAAQPLLTVRHACCKLEVAPLVVASL